MNNYMSENNNFASVNDQAGSAINNGPANPNNIVPGGNAGQPNQPQVDLSNYVKREEHDNLLTKLGEQGNELGEYRSLFENVSPILEILDNSPDLVRAIMDGKIDNSLADAVVKGQLTKSDAQVVTQAHKEVQKDLGKSGYANATPEEIAKMVEEQVAKVRAEAREEVDGKIKEVEEKRAFEAEVNDFIANTADFSQYKDKISQWLDEHEDVTDLKIAYYAVKGEMSEQEAAKRAEADRSNYAKNMALNAGGGSSQGGGFPEGVNPADVLIGGTSNPNNIFKM